MGRKRKRKGGKGGKDPSLEAAKAAIRARTLGGIGYGAGRGVGLGGGGGGGMVVINAAHLATSRPPSSKSSHSSSRSGRKGKKKLKKQRTLQDGGASESASASASASASVSSLSTLHRMLAASVRPNPSFPFARHRSVLVVGDGNLSFARGLALMMAPMGGSAGTKTLVATTYDAEPTLFAKYRGVGEILSSLASPGLAKFTHVVHEVDCVRLHEPDAAGAVVSAHAPFDAIIFNFPHVGGSTAGVDLVAHHRRFLTAFLESASAPGVLADGGEIHIALRNTSFYRKWNIGGLAAALGLSSRTYPFDPSFFPGYRNERTASGARVRTAPETDNALVYVVTRGNDDDDDSAAESESV